MLGGREGTHKHQHYHIKVYLTKIKISNSHYQHFFRKGDFLLFLTQFPFQTHSAICIYLIAFFRRHPNTFYNIETSTPKQTDILHEHSVDSRRERCSTLLQCNNKSDFTLVSYSLTAFSSLELPVVFPFEADLISHIRTSIFLKRAE